MKNIILIIAAASITAAFADLARATDASPTISTKVITLDDGTKVVEKFRTITTPQGVKQVQASQPITADQLNAQITALQTDLALLSH